VPDPLTVQKPKNLTQRRKMSTVRVCQVCHADIRRLNSSPLSVTTGLQGLPVTSGSNLFNNLPYQEIFARGAQFRRQNLACQML